MNITFVAFGSEQLAITLLCNLAAEKGHNVNIAFSAALFRDHESKGLIQLFDDTQEVLETIRSQKPDILAFSALTMNYQWMLQIAREAKKFLPHVKTIFGGVHVSAVPDVAIARAEVDYVVVGEGEEAFLEIIDAIAQQDFERVIPNTRYKNPDGILLRGPQKGFLQELDTLPAYTKQVWEGITPIKDLCITMASRGCPYRCTFCFNNFFAELPEEKNKGKYVRTRSVEHVIQELKTVKERNNGLDWIDFEDDIFTVNRKWLKEFLEVYKAEINVPFQCLTHARYMDDEIAMWLYQAGCRWIQIGVQTMDDEFKNDTLRRYEKSDHIHKAIKSMIDAGIKVKVDHMFGLPGEPIRAQEKARELYADVCPAKIQTFWTCFLPGTELLKNGVRDGLVSKEQERRLNEGEDFYFFNNPENIKDPELVRICQGYMLLFKMYPLLPRFLRLRLKEKNVRWIPTGIKYFIGMLAELINSVWNGNPEIIAYLKYYKYHAPRIILKKLKKYFSGENMNPQLDMQTESKPG